MLSSSSNAGAGAGAASQYGFSHSSAPSSNDHPQRGEAMEIVKADVKIAGGGGGGNSSGGGGDGGSGNGSSSGGGGGGGVDMVVDDDDEIEFMGSSIGTTTLAQMPHQREVMSQSHGTHINPPPPFPL